MKKLYLVGGTMGVGKTTVCQALKRSLPQSVFLDGDWCWDSSPFQVNEETKDMVMDNICYLLNNFIHCSAYENIIFCWVMHKQSIIDSILERLDTTDCITKKISLVVTEKVLRERINSDIKAGIRTADVLDRSIDRISMYEELDTIKICTDEKTIPMIVDEIKAL